MIPRYRLSIFTVILLAATLAVFSCTKRKPEEPDYAPNSPFNPYPPDSATNVEHTTLDVTLSWTATDPEGNPLTCDIYLDTLNPPESLIASGVSSSSYFLTGLSYNTTYYWRLYLTDDQGVTTSGPVWRFTTLPHANTAPNIPTYLYPADNAPWEYPTLTLRWTGTDPEGSSDTLHYDMYLGKTPQVSPTPYENDTTSSHEFTGLDYTTTYYWKVVVHDNHYAYNTGPVHSFTTRECPWFYKRDMPSPRYGFGTAVFNDKIYVFGGYDGFNYLSEVLEYDPATDTWTRKADMPAPRSDMAVAAWNGKIYVIGGRSSLAAYDNNDIYDPLSNTWNTLAPLPQKNYGLTSQAVNGKIYTVGGLPVYGFPACPVFEYDIATNDWWDTTYYDTMYHDSIPYDSIVWIDTINILWKSMLEIWRYGFSSAVYNDDIYLFGGHPSGWPPSSCVDIYHPVQNIWTEGTPMIGPADFTSAVTGNGAIYVLGGYGHDFFRRTRKYDPITDTWFIRGDMQDYRSMFGAAFINNRIYAFGGAGLFPLGTVEEYRIELDP